MRDRMDLRSRTHGLGRRQTAFGVDEVRSEDGIDES